MSGEKGRGVLGRPGFRRGGGGVIGGREVMYVDSRERDVGAALGWMWGGWVVGGMSSRSVAGLGSGGVGWFSVVEVGLGCRGLV
jgi:hypothetical protein